MEGVTVNVDSGSSGRMEVDKDEGDVEGEAEGRRGQKSGKEIGWDELCVLFFPSCHRLHRLHGDLRF
jgi:hypothetical protein